MTANNQLVIVIRITPEGLQPPEIHASSESDEIRELLEGAVLD